jgi:nucleoside triphosphatase
MMARQRFPEPTVGALILSPGEKLFLVRSHKWRGRYAVPGGHIELGERMEEALRREVREETGLDIHNIEFLCFQEFIYDDDFWEKRHFIFFDFACRTDSTAVVLNDEGQEYVWASIEEALRLPIEPYTRVAIQKYVEKRGHLFDGRCRPG